MKKLLWLLAMGAVGAAGAAELALSPLFADHMVVAEGPSLRVFGTGDGTVAASFRGATATGTSQVGAWCVELPSGPAGGPFVLEVKLNGQVRQIRDVMVGEVLVMAGQSNVQFRLGESATPPAEWVDDPLIRSFSLPRLEKGEPYSPKDGWVPLTRANAGQWSALGYHVARCRAARHRGVAVGIVNCYQGASVIQAWMPAATANDPRFALPPGGAYFFDHNYPYFRTWNTPGRLYEKAFGVLAPYAVSHVTWYQGESNTGPGEAAVYPALFAAMADAWRRDLREPHLPFTVVQIANLKGRGEEPGWKDMQAAQLKIPAVCPDTVVVASADVCEDDNIHPKTKRLLAQRIADTIGVAATRRAGK